MTDKNDEYLKKVHDLAKRLVKLLDEPQQGMSSWCMFYGEVMNELTKLWTKGEITETMIEKLSEKERLILVRRLVPELRPMLANANELITAKRSYTEIGEERKFRDVAQRWICDFIFKSG